MSSRKPSLGILSKRVIWYHLIWKLKNQRGAKNISQFHKSRNKKLRHHCCSHYKKSSLVSSHYSFLHFLLLPSVVVDEDMDSEVLLLCLWLLNFPAKKKENLLLYYWKTHNRKWYWKYWGVTRSSWPKIYPKQSHFSRWEKWEQTLNFSTR